MTDVTADSPPISFDNSYARLPEQFYAKLPPTPVRAPALIRVNEALAEALDLDVDYLKSPSGLEMLAGNTVPAGAEPLAMAYAGHQFGGWSPQLGDGRAILLGEIVDRDGIRRDIQLKGSGRTPFSRMGDGRAALGPVLREYIISEAMHALGIPTTRSLAAVTTGEAVQREGPIPGAVLTRVARSHIRVGTFQYFASRQDIDAVRALADHVIERHYPDATKAERPYLALLEAVVEQQASLVAKWLSVGFIHGVMNTDNMSIAGETIDYGPCAFMDAYHPAKVFSSIDEGGRYAYANQPTIAHWNLTRLAESLLPIIDDAQETALQGAQDVISGFSDHFKAEFTSVFSKKLGLTTQSDDDMSLIQDLLSAMAEDGADFTLTFHGLANIQSASPPKSSALESWVERWRARIGEEGLSQHDRDQLLNSANPAVIPRNHRVEEAIRAAEDNSDFSPFEQLLERLAKPFDTLNGEDKYMAPPGQHEVVRQTFCGT